MKIGRLALLVALSGCEDGGDVDPPVPPLEPIDRRGVFTLALSSETTAARAADHAAALGGTGVLLTGALSPLAEVPAEAASGVLAALHTNHLAGGPPFGFELPVLPAEPPPTLCFDPQSPTADPWILARSTALEEALSTWEAGFVLVDPTAPTPTWAVTCACEPCTSTDNAGQASRVQAVWSAFGPVTRAHVAEAWLRGSTAPSSPDATVEAVMAATVRGFGRTGAPTVVAPQVGPAHPWAPDAPLAAEAIDRRQAGWFDLGRDDGPTEALLLRPDDLWDAARTGTRDGVVGWMLNLDGPWGSAYATLDGVEVDLMADFVRDRALTPGPALAARLATRFGLPAEDPAILGLTDALLGTGRAFDLATHPAGITLDHLSEGLPATFPFSYLDPRPWDAAWEDRWNRLHGPDEYTLVEFGQWGAEAMALAAAARQGVEEHAASIPPEAAAELGRGVRVLDLAVRAWSLAVRADLALRARSAVAPERLEPWLRSDAAALDALAVDADLALAEGLDPFPADPTRLRALASAIREEVGPGDSADRAFPAITEIGAGWIEGRASFTWRITPSGSAALRTGLRSPAVDDAGPSGDEPAATWQAWLDELPPGFRLWWRPCGNAGGIEVCAAERVFHTPTVTPPER